MPSWHPAQYLLFGDHRTRPARDLLAAIPAEAPGDVVDVGCGPGNSTSLLVERWPEAGVVGVDSSPAMIERARGSLPGIRFFEADLREWRPPAPVDVVFSNATLHWLDDHPPVLAHVLGWLAPGGTLAVQMPANFDQPSHSIMRELAASPRWRARVGGVLRAGPVAAPEEYWRLLGSLGSVDIWTTEYLQVMEGENPITDWVRGTSLRPVLDRLGDEAGAEFVAEYADRVREAYPRQADGTTLFPFRRIFIVVQLP